MRRSRAARDPVRQVSDIRDLLDNFVELLESPGLRAQVRGLIPVVHALRDLGSGLVEAGDASSAMDRILAYLRTYPRTLIDGDELMVVSGIGEWARRVRQLRVEHGWTIYTGTTLKDMAENDPVLLKQVKQALGIGARSIRPDQYVLMKEDQDREAAFRWNQLNSVRKKGGSIKSKILEYLRLNVGKPVTGEELRYLANNKSEWARRTRELRTEEGWPVFTRMQGRPDLAVGEYLLEEDKQAPEHDRHIPDSVRIEVLQRDGFKCTVCGWSREDLRPDDPRKLLELHHIVHHVEGGANTAENLVTLCNVHHDEVHSGAIEL